MNRPSHGVVGVLFGVMVNSPSVSPCSLPPPPPLPPLLPSLAQESLWLCVSALLLRLLFWACVPLVLTAVGCQICRGGSKNDHMDIHSIFNHAFQCQLKVLLLSPSSLLLPKSHSDTYPLQFFHSMLVLFVVQHGGSVMFVVSC